MPRRLTPSRQHRLDRADEGGLGEKYGNNYGFGREGERVEPIGPPAERSEYVDRYREPYYPQPGEGEGPYAGVGPKGYQRSDERIHDEVCERLSQHGHIDASTIDLDVRQGEVYLRGTIQDRRMKRLAEDVALNVPGVVDVQNELRIQR